MITPKNMLKNYKIIDKQLREEELIDRHKFETFVFYFLHRVVFANLKVEQTDAPMIFETINDRGLTPQHHEILKGKLLGQINKNEVGKYSELWEEKVKEINKDSGKKKGGKMK